MVETFGAEFIEATETAVYGSGPWKYMDPDGTMHVYRNGVWFVYYE